LRHVHDQKMQFDAPIAQALADADLNAEQVIDRSPLSLSFGEMRRLAFAVALSLRPKFLLLDEPTACLDRSGKRILQRIVGRFLVDGGTVLIASHDIDFLFEACDRLIYLDDGRLLDDLDIACKSLPDGFAWPHEPPPLILALQEAMAELGVIVNPRAVTAKRLREYLE
ncbi:MAG: ATP-binding cassette domain-containing protein, partial [Candidatus Latescibacterota bacterium]